MRASPRSPKKAAPLKTRALVLKKAVRAPLAEQPKLAPAALKQIYSFVKSVAGRKGVRVVRSMGDGATDEVIEDKTGMKVSEIRHVLNQLHKHGVVEYTREKNMTTGWFTYTWKFNLDRTTKNFLRAKARRQFELRNALAQERATQFYACPKGCSRLRFDEAVDAAFRCKCGRKLAFEDNSKRIIELEGELDAVNELLANAP